ncbi:hypothetical protein CRENPOLYSF2_760003 [Crenothrix polyspora]|uniref:Uncharacterized protein n=1 Tax=Crenothrix polyspora TaxID=360316 RepID=A0A1R4HI05_9GAMM|nr:hypothetical protein [Crenothrix polyspora]SJM95829.1 hypothetical protein CRENPOLYSF2_760003 [Crenothrix polyspora]
MSGSILAKQVRRLTDEGFNEDNRQSLRFELLPAVTKTVTITVTKTRFTKFRQ